jgi:membrane-associated phospholipid phosphatase
MGISLHYHIRFVNMIAFFIMAVGAVATSRLYMHAHSMKEIIAGIVIGALPQIALWYYWL